MTPGIPHQGACHTSSIAPMSHMTVHAEAKPRYISWHHAQDTVEHSWSKSSTDLHALGRHHARGQPDQHSGLQGQAEEVAERKPVPVVREYCQRDHAGAPEVAR